MLNLQILTPFLKCLPLFHLVIHYRTDILINIMLPQSLYTRIWNNWLGLCIIGAAPRGKGIEWLNARRAGHHSATGAQDVFSRPAPECRSSTKTTVKIYQDNHGCRGPSLRANGSRILVLLGERASERMLLLIAADTRASRRLSS